MGCAPIPEIWLREYRVRGRGQGDLQGVRHRVDAHQEPPFGPLLPAHVLLHHRAGTDPGQPGADHHRWRPRLEGFCQGAPEHHPAAEGVPRCRPGLPRRLPLRVASCCYHSVVPLCILLALVILHVCLRLLPSKSPSNRTPILRPSLESLCRVKRALVIQFTEASFAISRRLPHGNITSADPRFIVAVMVAVCFSAARPDT